MFHSIQKGLSLVQTIMHQVCAIAQTSFTE